MKTEKTDAIERHSRAQREMLQAREDFMEVLRDEKKDWQKIELK